MKTAEIRRRLQAATGSEHLVRIDQTSKPGDRESGFVLAVGRKWVLLASTRDGGFFDGYAAIRITDVRRVRDDTSFESRATRLRAEWPPSFPRPLTEVDLDTTAGVLRSMAMPTGLIGIESTRRRNAMWIGALHSLTRHWVYLHEVRSDATWHDVPLGYRLGKVTTVYTDSQYQRGLLAIAGTPPEID
ncbi:hypothetical protein [Curtobacterium sp. MCBA15_001]|uniref:hypothetical protein n=1 Tax=Curtobacterium sp. MCBA15_001 TaxID=1898731 RepID=UPI0008DE2EA4|nr:hypothetical protein [Curtobacterium sp. MCBA15_001]OIH94484.1 hypothetical protein BIU90_04995 [Curtobacterium sp. MCBA15_001]